MTLQVNWYKLHNLTIQIHRKWIQNWFLAHFWMQLVIYHFIFHICLYALLPKHNSAIIIFAYIPQENLF